MAYKWRFEDKCFTYFQEKGNYPHNIFFIHGFNSSKAIVHSLVKVPNRPYRIIALDLPGFGESQILKHVSVSEIARVVRNFIKEVVPSNTVLMAHSLGCLFAVMLAKEKKINSLILVAGTNPWEPPHNIDWWEKILFPVSLAASARTVDLLFYNAKKYGDSLLRRLENNLYENAAQNKKVFWHMLKNEVLVTHRPKHFAQPFFSNLNKPITIIHGQNDVFIPVITAVNLSLRLGAALKIINHCGHSPLFEKPFVVDATIRSALKFQDRQNKK